MVKSFGHHFKFRGCEVYRFGLSRDLFWFRIFGYGLHLSSTNIPESPFAEKIGKHKLLVIGNIRIKTLPFIYKRNHD